MSERKIQQDIFALANSRPDVRLFRNSVGLGYVGRAVFPSTGQFPGAVVIRPFRKVHFGLRPGSADLVGWKTVTITPDMVGKKVAVFLSIETKSETGTLDDEQLNWLRQVQSHGGIAAMAKTEAAARVVIDSPPRGTTT
jgi:hypothetical protein